MSQPIKISSDIEKLMQCPICSSALKRLNNHFLCLGENCHNQYPIVDGIPVLLNVDNSLFSFNEFTARKTTTFTHLKDGYLKRTLKQMVPSISLNLKAEQNYKKLIRMLSENSSRSIVLIVGGGILGCGMEELSSHPSIELVETDVALAPRTQLIADSHDIPFSDNAFDAVITQAMLGSTLDPYRCVEEIHRVLKPGGLVYAETPFMQPVWGGRYDFTRFTPLGFRWLFRNFDEVDSGIQGGPGMGLAWYVKYFLLSFSDARWYRTAVWIFSSFTTFWLKYFDRFLTKHYSSYDAASGVYLIGRKNLQPLSGKELIKLYKGGFH